MIVVVWFTGIPNTPSPKYRWLFVSSPRDKLGVIICYYVKDDINILRASQKMPVGKQPLKGTALRLCALSSVICFFSFKDNRTVKLYHDFLPDRSADGDLLLTFSSNIFNFRRSPLARGTETCRIVRSFYN